MTDDTPYTGPSEEVLAFLKQRVRTLRTCRDPEAMPVVEGAIPAGEPAMPDPEIDQAAGEYTRTYVFHGGGDEPTETQVVHYDRYGGEHSPGANDSGIIFDSKLMVLEFGAQLFLSKTDSAIRDTIRATEHGASWWLGDIVIDECRQQALRAYDALEVDPCNCGCQWPQQRPELQGH